MNEEPIIEVEDIKKNKTGVGRISRLFQKKAKKKNNVSSSNSSLSITDSKHYTSSIASSISEIPDRNSFLDTRSYDAASINSKLTRTMSIKSTNSINIHQLLQQQRNFLKELDMQKTMLTSDVTKLEEQVQKTQEKLQQRSHDLEILEGNYQAHLRSVRSSDDDPESIGHKIMDLRKRIHVLASQLLPHAEQVTSERLSTLWINLSDSIKRLGTPLEPARIQMLTEKFMMDVLVQNLNINFFPGLSCNSEFLELQNWLDNQQQTFFSTRLRQELSLLVVQQKEQEDVKVTWKKCADRNWNHLYKGLQKAYPTYLAKKTSDQPLDPQQVAIAQEYGQKLRGLVEYAMNLGSAIKGQEVCITAVDVREGFQPLDSQLMIDEDGQTTGTIAFCISPPFVVKLSNRYEPLVKGRVLCFQPS